MLKEGDMNPLPREQWPALPNGLTWGLWPNPTAVGNDDGGFIDVSDGLLRAEGFESGRYLTLPADTSFAVLSAAGYRSAREVALEAALRQMMAALPNDTFGPGPAPPGMSEAWDAARAALGGAP